MLRRKHRSADKSLALLSFLKPFFRVMVEKYTKFLQRIILAWYFFKLTAIIVSMAKETIGIQQDDAISAYNGGKLNFPWPTENLNFAPRMCMLNWRPSPLRIPSSLSSSTASQTKTNLPNTYFSYSPIKRCELNALGLKININSANFRTGKAINGILAAAWTVICLN